MAGMFPNVRKTNSSYLERLKLLRIRVLKWAQITRYGDAHLNVPDLRSWAASALKDTWTDEGAMPCPRRCAVDTRADQEVWCMKGNQVRLFSLASWEETEEMGVRHFRMVIFVLRQGLTIAVLAWYLIHSTGWPWTHDPPCVSLLSAGNTDVCNSVG